MHNGSSQGAWTLPPDPHEEFEELCALSTTGELTAEEWARLEEHLSHCDACRNSQRQYEHVVTTAIPALAEEDGVDQDNGSSPGTWSIERAEATLMESLRGESSPSNGKPVTPSRPSPRRYARRYAVAAVILAACSVAGYRASVYEERRADSVVASAPLPIKIIPPRFDRSLTEPAPPDAKAAPQDSQTAALRNQLGLDQLEVAELKETQGHLEDELATRSADLDRSLQDRAELNRQLTLAQAQAQSLQAKLDQINGKKPQDTSESLALKTQVNDLNAALQDKNKEIAQEKELLQHDRDIRNLIGARNLYIAEIYDIAKTGDTQKPFGRVFYTKDKSLIFYGYDLDKQRGVKQTSAFQAWGRHGADRQHDVSLGLLYQDDASQKRWVLKFNDAKTIAQLDAVFVTVEPRGGSTKPSGKPLLFTYLRLDPNHP